MAKRHRSEPISWLPIDSRIIPHIFSFGHVKGITKLFLQVEMVLSVGVVLGTLIIVFLRMKIFDLH
jgi:hypothetical protein